VVQQLRLYPAEGAGHERARSQHRNAAYRGTSAGGGYSTAADLARFAQALLNHQLLRPETTHLLITGKAGRGPGARYAYGFEDRRDRNENGSVGHNGGAPGMNGSLLIYRVPATSRSRWQTWIRQQQAGSPNGSAHAFRRKARSTRRPNVANTCQRTSGTARWRP
jgi:CubicO group peptidase (beta-lactamase class C family)